MDIDSVKLLFSMFFILCGSYADQKKQFLDRENTREDWQVKQAEQALRL